MDNVSKAVQYQKLQFLYCFANTADDAAKSVLTKRLVLRIKKSSLHYTCAHGITPKRVTSGRVHLRNLAPRLHSSEVRLHRWKSRWRHLNGPEVEPPTSRTNSLCA